MKKFLFILLVIAGLGVLSSCHRDQCPAYKISAPIAK
jgi:hypothetical protein